MRTKKFFYNSISAVAYQIVLIFTGFIIPKIMLKYYGSEINGLVSSINQFITYFNLVEVGLSGAAIYALYKPIADNNYKAINGIVSAAKKFYIRSGYLFVLLTIGLAIIYPILVTSNNLSPTNISLLILIIGVNGTLEFFTLAKYRVLLSADQRTYIISLSSIIYKIFDMLIFTILAVRKVNIVIVRFVALLSVFLRSFLLMCYTKTKYKFLNYNEKPNYNALNKRWDVLYLQILGVIHTGAPVIILTIITNDLKLVSVYTIFNMVLDGLNSLLSIFTSGLSASFGDVIVRNQKSILKEAYSEFEFFYYIIITIAYSIAFITIMPFIRIYTKGVTDINYDIPIIGILFVLNGFLYNIKTPQGMLVISAGLFKETKIQTTIQGLIAVIIGIILTPFLGIVGVLIGSILSNLYRDVDLIFYIPKNVTKLPVRKTIYRIIRMLISIIIIWMPFLFIKINPTDYVSWIIDAMIVGIYVTIVVFGINLLFEKNVMINIYKRMIGIIKR